MKKLSLILFASLAFADNYGIIEAINDAQKSIVVHQTTIKVLPFTKIEEEACGSGWDIPKKFSDLKVGQMVEVDFMGVEDNLPIAKEIEIKCANRAY